MMIEKQIEFAAAEWRQIQFALDEISDRIAILIQYDKSFRSREIAAEIRKIEYKCEKRANLLYKLLDIPPNK